MTAEKQGQGVGAVLKLLARLRDRWLLVVTLLTALFWLRDRVEVYVDLPGTVAGQGAALAEMAERVSGIDTRLAWAERWLMRCAEISGTAEPRQMPVAFGTGGPARAGASGKDHAAACGLDP